MTPSGTGRRRLNYKRRPKATAAEAAVVLQLEGESEQCQTTGHDSDQSDAYDSDDICTYSIPDEQDYDEQDYQENCAELEGLASTPCEDL